MDQFYIADSSG